VSPQLLSWKDVRSKCIKDLLRSSHTPVMNGKATGSKRWRIKRVHKQLHKALSLDMGKSCIREDVELTKEV
jgi:hypothetical protein